MTKAEDKRLKEIEFQASASAFIGVLEAARSEILQSLDFLPIQLFELLHRHTVALRDAVNDPDNPGSSWERPSLSTWWPVGWDREERRVMTFRLTPEDFKDEETTKERLTSVLHWDLELVALSLLTQEVAFVKEGDKVTAMTPEPDASALRDLPEEERERFVDGARFKFGIGPESAADPEQLIAPDWGFVLMAGEGGEHPALGIAIPVEMDGTVIHAIPTLTIHPLFVDLDEDESGFASDFDLHLHQGDLEALSSGEPIAPPDTSAWTEDHWEKVWEKVLQDLDAIIEAYKAHYYGTDEDEPEETPQAETKPSPVFPAAAGKTMVDRGVLSLAKNIPAIRRPARKFSSLKTWTQHKEERIEEILQEYGEDAFIDLRARYKDTKARGPLLKKRNIKGTIVPELTDEEERELKKQKGRDGYIDRNADGQEGFVRVLSMGKSSASVWLSFGGEAGPLTNEWWEKQEENIRQMEGSGDGSQLSILGSLDEDTARKLDRTVNRVRAYRDAWRLMEMLHHRVHREGTTMFLLSALELKKILGAEDDPHWVDRVRSALRILRRSSFQLDTVRGGRQKADRRADFGEGSFVSEFYFHAMKNREGYFLVLVGSGYLGCLDLFVKGTRSLPDKRGAWSVLQTTNIPREDWKELKKGLGQGGYIWTDAAIPYLMAEEQLTDHQRSLVNFLLPQQITKEGDGASSKLRGKGGADAAQVQGSAAPRTYDRSLCPVLPDGKRFHGLLGHYSRNRGPESGWRLGGAGSRPSRTGGGHQGGLIFQMGRTLPRGREGGNKRAMVRDSIGDLRRVIEEWLGGVVAVRYKDQWLSLSEAEETLTLKELLSKNIKVYPFVPADWLERAKGAFEESAGYALTEDLEEAKRAQIEAITGVPADLHERLRAKMKEMGWKQGDVAEMLGVSQPMVSKMLKGVTIGEDGTLQGNPFPADRVPDVERLIEEG